MAGAAVTDVDPFDFCTACQARIDAWLASKPTEHKAPLTREKIERAMHVFGVWNCAERGVQFEFPNAKLEDAILSEWTEFYHEYAPELLALALVALGRLEASPPAAPVEISAGASRSDEPPETPKISAVPAENPAEAAGANGGSEPDEAEPDVLPTAPVQRQVRKPVPWAKRKAEEAKPVRHVPPPPAWMVKPARPPGRSP